MRLLEGIRQRLSRVRNQDAGFTLIEIVVATGVILTALSLMGGVLTSGLRSTAISRERQTANGLANQTLEVVRALPFATLRRGLDNTDLASTANTTDPRVTTSGCTGATYCFQGEPIVSGTNPTADPLVPHMKTITSGDTVAKQFTVSTYVTWYNSDPTANTFRVTTRVSWTSVVRASSTQDVEAQTIVFPNGCLSLPDHPYSGPCQASFTASAEADPATISAGGTVGGVDIAKAVLYSAAASSDATIEQTARVDGIAQGSGATIQAVGGAETTIGRSMASSQADNDPEATTSIYQTADLPAQAAGSTTLSSSTGTLNAVITGGDAGRTTSTTSASTAAARNCPNLTGVTNETDSIACGGSTATPGTSAALNATLNVGALTAASFPLASLGTQVNPSTAIVDRTTATGVDTSRATVSRSALTFGLGGLPTVLKPVGFATSFVNVTGYNDSATAQAGVGSTAPSAGATGGTLSYFTGNILSPYTTINLSSITGSTTIPTVNLSVPLLGTTITLAATITPESKTTTSTCTGTCTRTSGSAKVAPLKISVTVTVVVGGVTALNVTTELDPGTIQAKTSYVAAPAS